MNITGIHHIAIIAGDYEKCKTFYSRVLGFKIIRETYRQNRQSYKLDLSINGVGQLELFSFPVSKERQSYPEAKGLRHLAFAVKDIDAAVNHLKENGVEVQEVRVDELTGQRFCFFNDPSGQPLELYECH